jgi:hypothetical protein
MSSNLFQKAFVHVLHEAPEVAQDPSQISDETAMQQTLDKGSSVDDFGVDGGAVADHMEATTKMQALH